MTRKLLLVSPALLIFTLLYSACDDSQETGSECVLDRDCGAGMYCDNGYCRVDPALADEGRRRDATSDSATDDAGADDPDLTPQDQTADPAPSDVSADTPADTPTDNGGDPCDGSCGSDPSDDPLAALSTECGGFCDALCDFLLECGKDDPTCLDRCGLSTRYQQLSTAACTEGSQVIGLEECRLWLDCGGSACGIDEMCLEVIPGLSYRCAPICDHTQSQPVCPTGTCQTVSDANGSVMTSLGMCFSIF